MHCLFFQKHRNGHFDLYVCVCVCVCVWKDVFVLLTLPCFSFRSRYGEYRRDIRGADMWTHNSCFCSHYGICVVHTLLGRDRWGTPSLLPRPKPQTLTSKVTTLTSQAVCVCDVTAFSQFTAHISAAQTSSSEDGFDSQKWSNVDAVCAAYRLPWKKASGRFINVNLGTDFWEYEWVLDHVSIFG